MKFPSFVTCLGPIGVLGRDDGHDSPRDCHAAVLLILFALAIVTGCDDDVLRGWVEPSEDGGTYLAIADDSGGCEVWVDGRPWDGRLNEPKPVEAGVHVVSCGGVAEIEFEVEEGTTFHFDYWGP